MILHTLQLTLHTPALDDRPVWVTGNFCGWSGGHELVRREPGQYRVDLAVEDYWPDPLDYKFSRGETGSYELTDAGEPMPNHRIPRVSTAQTDHVPFWQWNGAPYRPHWLPRYLEHTFAYPTPDTPRRVRVLLPADYDTNPQARYPVLYLNDGQNILGEGEGYGSWRAEERLAMLASRGQHELILVAIDHGSMSRFAEYTVGEARTGPGRGEDYLKFLIDTVKLYLDATYRTRPEARYTGIGGSSLGGLISLFGGLLRPDVFGRWLIFSPSLWIAPGILNQVASANVPDEVKVYLYGGGAESRGMARDLVRLKKALESRPKGTASPQLKLILDPTGKHEEWRWSRELPQAIEYLFF